MGKSKVHTRLGEENGDGGKRSEADAMANKDVVNTTSIEGQRCGVNIKWTLR